MLTAFTYSQVLERLDWAFKHRYDQPGLRRTRMVGFLFARPSSSLAKDEIVPNLDYFHGRSGDHFDFFGAGYALGPEPDRQHSRVIGSRGDFWVFNLKEFDAFRREIESRTSWAYSGGCDLLLSNAQFDPSIERASIEFSTSIVCQLDAMRKDNAIFSIEQFFEQIIRFTESTSHSDPTWGFSDSQGVAIAGSALKRLVLSLLPKKLGEDAQRLQHLAVRDVQRR